MALGALLGSLAVTEAIAQRPPVAVEFVVSDIVDWADLGDLRSDETFTDGVASGLATVLRESVFPFLGWTAGRRVAQAPALRVTLTQKTNSSHIPYLHFEYQVAVAGADFSAVTGVAQSCRFAESVERDGYFKDNEAVALGATGWTTAITGWLQKRLVDEGTNELASFVDGGRKEVVAVGCFGRSLSLRWSLESELVSKIPIAVDGGLVGKDYVSAGSVAVEAGELIELGPFTVLRFGEGSGTRPGVMLIGSEVRGPTPPSGSLVLGGCTINVRRAWGLSRQPSSAVVPSFVPGDDFETAVPDFYEGMKVFVLHYREPLGGEYRCGVSSK